MRLWTVATLFRNSCGATSLKSPENVPATAGDITMDSPSATANVSSAMRRSMSRATSVYVGSFHGISAASAVECENVKT